MGGKKGGQERRVVDYFMSMHYGICTGPVDEILNIKIKEKVAWRGNLTENATIRINKPGLFGGDEKEGGVIGLVDVLFGGASQTLSDWLAAKFGRTSATMPGYRGVMSLFFYGSDNADVNSVADGVVTGDENFFELLGDFFAIILGAVSPGSTVKHRGFMWCQNNPYLPPVSAKVRRRPRGLAAGTAMITRDEGVGVDANPAHIMYECYTNTDWALGWPTVNFDNEAWEAVAQTLYDEGFGISLQWVTSTEVEKFIGEVQDHIQAVIYERPDNGLVSIKLIRDDYDIADLFEINPDNAKLNKAERRSLDDTVNEIIVTWTNPANEKEETVTVQDLGNIAAQGRIVSEGRSYYGVRVQSLAMELAKRDLRGSSYPLFSCEAEMSRVGASLVPGDVIRLVWPELGIVEMACRVMDIDYGKPGSGGVILTLIEDIWGLEEGEFGVPVGSLWTDEPDEALPLGTTAFLTVPYPVLARTGLTGTPYPGVYVGALAQREQEAMSSFVLSTEVVLPDSSLEMRDYSGQLPTPAALTTVAMAREATTVMTDAALGAFSDSLVLTAGKLLYLSGDGDTTSEIVMLVSYAAGSWTIARGLYDTVPHAWPSGSLLWSLSDARAYDPSLRTPGAAISYWLRPVTLAGTLPLADATEEVFTPTERPHLPFRPTDIHIEGVAGFADYTYLVEPTEINVSWSNRNRTMEDSVALRWADPSVSGETGQLSLVRIRGVLDAILAEYPDLTGTSFVVPATDFLSGEAQVQIEVLAVRDGLESLQAQSRVLRFPVVEIPIPVGTFTLTGYVPELTITRNVDAPVGLFTLTGYPPEVNVQGQIDVVLGVYTLTGFAPEITVPPSFDQVEVAANVAYVLYRQQLDSIQIAGTRAYTLYRGTDGTYHVATVRAYVLYRTP